MHVREGPDGFLGTPLYERRLAEMMARGRRVLDEALDAAAAAGVNAGGEILEGSPRRRISEFARSRGARLVVVGSRRRKVGSVSHSVARATGPPVVVAQDDQLALAAQDGILSINAWDSKRAKRWGRSTKESKEFALVEAEGRRCRSRLHRPGRARSKGGSNSCRQRLRRSAQAPGAI